MAAYQLTDIYTGDVLHFIIHAYFTKWQLGHTIRSKIKKRSKLNVKLSYPITDEADHVKEIDNTCIMTKNESIIDLLIDIFIKLIMTCLP